MLYEVLHPTTAAVAATYRRDYYAGRPAVTINRYGEGHAIYVGALGRGDLYGPLVEWAVRLTGLPRPPVAAAGVEIVERRQGARRLIFVLNHTEQAQSVGLPGRFTDLLTGASDGRRSHHPGAARSSGAGRVCPAGIGFSVMCALRSQRFITRSLTALMLLLLAGCSAPPPPMPTPEAIPTMPSLQPCASRSSAAAARSVTSGSIYCPKSGRRSRSQSARARVNAASTTACVRIISYSLSFCPIRSPSR